MRRLTILLAMTIFAPLATAAQPAPVLVELFTSEGCSSCPPADAALLRLAEQQPLDGIEIIAVGEHVDYWDYLGWPDRFATAEFSELQRNYARTRRDGRVHTPQIVVNGDAMAVGNRESVVKALARRAAQDAPQWLDVSLLESTDDAVSVQVDVPAPETGSVLRVLLVERGLSTAVRNGENAGRKLAHAPTARVVEAQPISRSGQYAVQVPLPAKVPQIDLSETDVVAVLQRPAGTVSGVGRVAAQ